VSAAADTSAPLRAPFPWFGGKSRAASLIWEAFGDVSNYVEPFAGSLAVLLGRPHTPHIETVNDRDCYLANFWRAVQHDPEAVARHADHPVNEADLHAWHLWLVRQVEFRERMMSDPLHFDPQIAGRWVWGIGQWLGDRWCDTTSARLPRRVRVCRLVGLHGTEAPSAHAWFARLSERLRSVRVKCGDWESVLSPAALGNGLLTGVLLDPPYAPEGLCSDPIYNEQDAGLSVRVRAWAIEHGGDPQLRIALCGYEGEHAFPPTWRVAEWTAQGGLGNRAGNANRERERIWFSPACLRPAPVRQLSLLGSDGGAP